MRGLHGAVPPVHLADVRTPGTV